MRKASVSRRTLTRRSFLTGTAVAAGAVAAGSLSACSGTEAPAPEQDGSADEAADVSKLQPQAVAAPEEQKFFQSCMGNCSGWGCPCYVTVRDGKVANIERAKLTAPDGSPSPYQETCLKGYANIERMYAPNRVQYPMKRAGERGEGKWERISWDDAVKEITDKWKQLQSDYGPASVAFMSGSGSGMATISWTSRLQSLMGAMTIAPAYDNTGMYCQMNHGGLSGLLPGHNEHRDIPNTKNLFIWGTNPTESMIVDYHLVSEARDNGAKIIVIDPIFTTSAAHADLFVPIRPGTDGLLACGMAQIALRDGKADEAHLRTMTVAPFLVKDSDGLYLRLSDLGQAEAGSPDDRIMVYEGDAAVAFDAAAEPELEGSFEVEGIAVKTAYQILLDRLYEWDLDTIADYTDVPVATIEELAKIYTSDLSLIFTGFGPDHYANGQTAYDAMFALADITGMEAKHGAGICCSDFSAATSQGYISTATTDLGEAAIPAPTVHAPHFPQLMSEDGLGVIESAPKSCYFYIVNPIGNEPDRKKWVEGICSMEMVVVSDMFMSETATYADYVLPVAFLFERDDIGSSANPYVKLSEKAVEPAFESKSDFDIITMLGKGMGFDQYFTQTLEGFLESCVTNPVAEAIGMTWEKLKKEHALWVYPEEPTVVGLNTPPLSVTGRFEFYHENVQPMDPNAVTEWDQRKESCWFWEPPLEAWRENPLFEKYPLTFISERCKFKTHTMFNNAPMLLELDPEPYIKINPVDAEARGIKEGDTVRLFNDRGDVTLKAVINPGCRPGVLVIDHGWERDNFIDGHYSDLSSCTSWPRFEQDNWFDCLCEMEKVA